MKKSFSTVVQVVSMVFVLFLSGCLFTEEPVVDENTQMNHAPSPPQVNFNSSLHRTPGVFYLISASSTDVDEDNITYCFDFGDGTWFNSTSPLESGKTIRQHHSWNSPGSYILRVRASDEHGSVSEWTEVKVEVKNQTAPDFTIKTVDDKEFTLGEHRGEVILLNFFATQCYGCRCVLDQLKELSDDMKNSVTVVAVDVWFFSHDETLENLLQFKEEMEDEWLFAMDSSQTFVTEKYYEKSQLGISLPLTFLIDRKGRISYSKEGCVSKQVLVEEISKLL